MPFKESLDKTNPLKCLVPKHYQKKPTNMIVKRVTKQLEENKIRRPGVNLLLTLYRKDRKLSSIIMSICTCPAYFICSVPPIYLHCCLQQLPFP
jgi:hypothetical protein